MGDRLLRSGLVSFTVLLLAACGDDRPDPGASRATLEAPTARVTAEFQMPTNYIVRLDDAYAGDPEDFARGLGILPGGAYRTAFKGFFATLSPGQVKQLMRNPTVRRVELDQLRFPLVATPTEPATASTGTRRIDAKLGKMLNQIPATNGNRNVDVAVIDTGVDMQHPDLNLGGGVWYYVECDHGPTPTCWVVDPPSTNYDDADGHGTHVAGIIGAKENTGGGIVGVVPGARIWAVRVFQDSANPKKGGAYDSAIIKGIEWLMNTGNTNGNLVRVANMSLGGSDTNADDEQPCTNASANHSAWHHAMCAAVDMGITFAVAAGNNAQDARYFVPAKFPEVITVAAHGDFDGEPWRTTAGTVTCSNYTRYDDALACFSNYGARIDIMAPGLWIDSTFTYTDKGQVVSGYNSLSGTSMASPFVAGAAALYLAALDPADKSPAAVKAFLTTGPWRETAPCGAFPGSTCDLGVTEPLLYLGVVEEKFEAAQPDYLPYTVGPAATGIVNTAGPGGAATNALRLSVTGDGTVGAYATGRVCFNAPDDLYLSATFAMRFDQLKSWDAVGVTDLSGNWLYWWWIGASGAVLDDVQRGTVEAGAWHNFKIVVDYHTTGAPKAGISVADDGSLPAAPTMVNADVWEQSLTSPAAVQCLMVVASGNSQPHVIDVDNVVLRGRP